MCLGILLLSCMFLANYMSNEIFSELAEFIAGWLKIEHPAKLEKGVKYFRFLAHLVYQAKSLIIVISCDSVTSSTACT